VTTEDELRLEVENVDLRHLLAQAGLDAAEQKGIEKLQRLLLEELHHRVKNTLATVMAITSQSLRAADSLEHGRQAIEPIVRAGQSPRSALTS
jgi:two-component sensor histidine kinase